MTKTELEDIVITTYSLYNQIILEIDKKNILRAWWELLQDLPHAGIKQVLLDYACVHQFMPKAGDLRRAYIDSQTTVGETPAPLVAWGIVLRQIKLANSGVGFETKLHPCIVKTMELLKETLYTLHSTTDQINFIKVYDQVVSDFQAQKYKISSGGTHS